ncbi:MAG: hypothetical protein ACLUFN_03850 [Eubacterium sp.]
MLSLYNQVVIENLVNDVKECQLNYEIYVCDTKERIAEKVNNGIINFPIIGVTTSYYRFNKDIKHYSNKLLSELCEYSVTANDSKCCIKEYDYVNTTPMELGINFTVISNTISHIVELEEYINKKYSNYRVINLKNPNNSDETIKLEITIDNDIEIERTQNDDLHIFQSIITLKCSSYVPLFSSSYHPAQIQFDTKLQMNIVDKLNNLCRLLMIFSSLNNPLFDKESKLKNINSAQNNICNTLGIPLLYGQDESYTNELYSIMASEKCNISTAVKKLEEEIKSQDEVDKKEAERLRQIEEKFKDADDIALTYYTDAIVEDFKNRFPNVSVFGGSSFMEYFIEREKSTFKYPCIVVYTETDFSFSFKNYTNTTENGTPIVHNYTTDILPIECKMKVEVYAKDKEIKKELENKILEIYANEVLIQVEDYKYKNELSQISLTVESNIKYDMKKEINKEYICVAEIRFKEFQSVYYQTDYNLPDIKNNQRLQARQFQLAAFYCKCESKMLHSDLKPYKALFTKKINSEKGLLSRLSDGLGTIGNEIITAVQSDEYKIVRDNIQNGKPIDKTLFDKALIITSNYPNLYDKMIQGWSYKQIEDDLKKYAECFNIKWNKICNLLKTICPSIAEQLEIPEDKNKYSICIEVGLGFYCNKMLDSISLSIQECKELYDEQLRIERERYDAAWANLRHSIREDIKSSSGGFLGNMLSTAAGVSIGNSKSRNELKKQTQLMQQQADREKAEARRRQFETNYKRSQIIEENQKRSRKGLPKIPVPPGDYR